MNKQKRAWGLSIVAALFCPCCALPAMLSLLGSTGAVAQFGWLHSMKPLFMVVALASVVYLWYSYFQHQKKHATSHSCGCNDKPNPYQNKFFLMGLTAFIGIMTALPMFLNH